LGNQNGGECKMNKFLVEIKEQPDSLLETLDYYCSSEGEKRLDKISKLVRDEKFKQIIFTGMGSSYFTSYAAVCLFNSLGLNSNVMNTSELLYYHNSLINAEKLLVCISQSGESYEIVKLIEGLPANIWCIGISNEVESFLSKKANESLLSKAGKEEMTSTKTYTTILLVLLILGWHIAGKWGKERIDQIKGLITNLRQYLSNYDEEIKTCIEFFGGIEFIQFIGRGPSFANARQSELMFKEAAKIPASGSFGGEFRHGPMEMVKPGFKSIIFVPQGKTYSQGVKLTNDIAKYGGKVIMITNKDAKLPDPNIKVITNTQQDEYLFLIKSIIPVQLIVNSFALKKGLNPGDFEHGGKITLTE
jgi:glutamine---fructose-6-phosphate transaminase (isomerizing)